VQVLVTGVTGFTGGHLARALAVGGHAVRALVRRPDVEDSLRLDGLEPVVGDLRDRAAMARAVKGVEVVYNIAAIYRQASATQADYNAVNALAVGALVEEAARAGVRRVVHCSTVGVHGDIAHPPANEDAPLRPGDAYQRSKLAGERIARDAAARQGVEIVIARPSGIYGPGDRRLLKLFRQVVRRFPTLGRGEIYYHVTYIDDLVSGLQLCGQHPAAAGRTYILAGGEVTRLRELMALIADLAGVAGPSLRLPVWPFWLAGAACEAVCVPFGLEPPIYRRRVDFYTKSRAFDATRARTEIGYSPKMGLREGLARTLSWYQSHGWL
jgi:nucleoside-diphosphate-sugar epimerase